MLGPTVQINQSGQEDCTDRVAHLLAFCPEPPLPCKKMIVAECFDAGCSQTTEVMTDSTSTDITNEVEQPSA